ncbi:MAG: apolipoprotein N-acyltransferase [Candidatus Omnitrophica bacterium]|nr:apolipoprotein N-acyltransferase [Candidatus Omnitrophota bacterium]
MENKKPGLNAQLYSMRVFLFCAISSGLAVALVFDAPVFSFIAWGALVPFLWVTGIAPLRKGIFAALLFGLAYYGAALFWIAHVTVAGLIALLLYLSCYSILFFLLARNFINKPLAIISVPACWVVVEFLKESIWTGFGWANLGYSQYRNSYLIQIADIFGVKFISFLILMVNVSVYEALCKRSLTRNKIIFACLLLALVFAYSFYRLPKVHLTGSFNIALIQPNIPEVYKWDQELKFKAVEKLEKLGAKTEASALLIYPEAAWPYVIDESNFEQLRSFVANSKRNALIGAVARLNDKFYNTALLFDSKGALLGGYRKIKLVPFGEYVPMRRYLSFISAINAVGDMSPGSKAKVFSQADKRFSVLICFEDVSPSFVRDVRGENDFLVNITNDDWFGGEPEASQHFSIMVFRAIENRISIVRAANTGISGWVSPKGEMVTLKIGNSRVYSEGLLNCVVPQAREKSIYTKIGDIFPVLCGFMLFFNLFVIK